MDIVQRINEAVRWIIFEGLARNHSDLAKKLKYQKSSFSQIVNGRVKISGSFIDRLVIFAPTLNRKWLLIGEGNMLLSLQNFVNDEGVTSTNKGVNMVRESEATYLTKSEMPEVMFNHYGNKFTFYSGGSIDIEALKVPFTSYVAYSLNYKNESKLNELFGLVEFRVDLFEVGHYKVFGIVGDSMNGGNIDDTPDGAEVLAREIKTELWEGGFKQTNYGFVLVTKDGFMYKDIASFNKETRLLKLTGRNELYRSLEYPIDQVYQIFHVIKRLF